MSRDTFVRSPMDRRRLLKQSPIRSTHFCYSAETKQVSVLESQLEHDYYNLLTFDRSIQAFYTQPFSIAYQIDGRTRRYTPDFLEVDPDGCLTVTEVKTVKETLSAKFEHKFGILSALFRAEGKQFKIVTEREIQLGARASNLRYLKPVLRHPAPVAEMEVLSATLPYRTSPIRPLQAVITNNGWDPTLIRRAVAHGLMQCDLTQPWESIELSW